MSGVNAVQKASLVTSILIGTLFSCTAGLLYLVVLREPGSLFYPFAALAFLGGPFVAGAMHAVRSRGHGYMAILVPGAVVFCIMLALFFTTYAVLPHFDRTSVRLPGSCDGFASGPHPAPSLAYALPGIGDGVLIARDERTVVVAMIDYTCAPYPSTVYIADERDNRILRRLDFPDDIVVAAIEGGTVVLYNDKLGYLIDARTGTDEATFLVIDNYGGLSATDRPVLAGASGGRRYLETSAVISSWSIDGTVRSRSRLMMNGIACTWFVNGTNGEILEI
jgi:hypothetical protein